MSTENDEPLPALILSIFMCVGIFVSYLPQHLKIIRRKSSDGLSPWYQLLGALSMLCILENTLMTGYRNINNCSKVDALICSRNVIAVLQVIVQSFCFMFMVLLFIWYFPLHRRYIPSIVERRHSVIDEGTSEKVDIDATNDDENTDVLSISSCSGNCKRERTAEYSRALNIGLVVGVFALLTFTISALFMIIMGDPTDSRTTSIWTNILGGFSTTVALMQFIPQLLQTFQSQQVGALSIPAMLMQTPGSFIIVYTLSSTENSQVSTWITYVVTGILQCCLLIMCIIFTIRDRRLQKLDTDMEDKEPLITGTDRYSDVEEEIFDF